MSCDESIVNFIVEQLQDAGLIQAKKMFGEYGLYCNGKIIALICDDQLFIKPTHAGKNFIGTPVEAAPYPGAKLYYLISGEFWDQREWLTTLVQLSFNELPDAKPRPQSKRSSTRGRPTKRKR